jgi:hypothetical protein
MANNCINYIKVQGENLDKFRKALKESVQQAKLGYGWMAKEVIDGNHDYLKYWFDTEILVDDVNQIHLNNWTKWAWMEESQMRQFCRLYEISMLVDYEESGMEIYGRAFYDYLTDEFTEVFLTQSETDRVQYDEETDKYTLDGNESDQRENPDEWYGDMINEKWGNSITHQTTERTDIFY